MVFENSAGSFHDNLKEKEKTAPKAYSL